MSYATQAGLVARFGEAELLANTDRAGLGTIDSAIVDKAIATAANTIDSYIGTRYALPLVTVPPVITTICEALARRALYTIERPKSIDDDADMALAQLKDISRGIAALDAPAPASAPAASSGNEILFEPGDRGVSRAELRKL